MNLEDALASGFAGEVPITCPNPEHEDRHASASVNTALLLWYCYGCQSWGDAKGVKHTPTDDQLLAMLEPDAHTRVMSPRLLELYARPVYWLERFPEWLCRALHLGQDPLTGYPTYPVHTPRGQLAGITRRIGGARKYLYPTGWSAAQSLWGSNGVWEHHEVLAVVEGAADAAAVRELGVPAFATYGAGVHAPQYQLLRRMTPKVVLVGFDDDEAGAKAAAACTEQLEAFTVPVRVHWPHKDPAESRVDERWAPIETVVPAVYGRYAAWRDDCNQRVHDTIAQQRKAA